MLLFLSDDNPNDNSPANPAAELYINSTQPDPPVTILTYAFATSNIATLRNMAQHHGGVYTEVSGSGDLRAALGRFYTSVSVPSPTQDPVWTVPYFDASGESVVVCGGVVVAKLSLLIGT